jgi:hypothetical protein
MLGPGTPSLERMLGGGKKSGKGGGKPGAPPA